MTTVPDSSTASRIERVELNLLGGESLGQDLQEFDTRLRVDLGSGVVFLERHQPGADNTGESIGTYRAEATPASIEALRAAVAAVDFATLPRAEGGGAGISNMTLRVIRSDGRQEVTWTVRDGELEARLSAVNEALDELMSQAVKAPLQAIAVEVAEGSNGFVLIVKNVGGEAVAIRNPRLLGADGDEAAHVRYAVRPKPTPGVTQLPPEWQPLPLAPGKPQEPPYLVLPAGGEQRFETVAWKRAAGTRYLVQAALSSYAGAAMYASTLVIRGRASSRPLVIEP